MKMIDSQKIGADRNTMATVVVAVSTREPRFHASSAPPTMPSAYASTREGSIRTTVFSRY